MIRGLAAVAVGVALLFAVGGTAGAQEDPPAPSVTPAPSAEPTPSPSPEPSPTSEPSAEPSPTTVPTTSAPPTSPAAPSSSSAAPSTTSRAPATTSRPTRAPGTGAGAAAAAGPTITPSTRPSATSTEYSALVPWIPADDQPGLLLLAVLLLASSGTAGVVMFERDRTRRNAIRDRYDLTR